MANEQAPRPSSKHSAENPSGCVGREGDREAGNGLKERGREGQGSWWWFPAAAWQSMEVELKSAGGADREPGRKERPGYTRLKPGLRLHHAPPPPSSGGSSAGLLQDLSVQVALLAGQDWNEGVNAVVSDSRRAGLSYRC
ncbi:hypothetical protein Dda_6518 [Drechslerella dactyloides]|uniref:Uncharacterized protein n=1 Tax=Drechslerella dactyloides TaxID=74499 RepID=A0AAD6NG99_DREDA|nr:hypothetical protein Dda_6518 [Drechslerella dactyloides]